ncbi:MAG: protein kinase [Labilithrix sp.]|nr:protein kinase [Labilithrix sp.]
MRPTAALAPPKQLGKYEVGAKIGGGGMATVYIGRAVREDGVEERVALKVIRDELAHDEEFSSMFIDEAKILARLSHPNVIHTLEYGVTGHHRFIAMELLSGRTYSDVFDIMANNGERLDHKLAAWICARVADGLHSAHELLDEGGSPLSVIHRDVNPSNIFLVHGGDVKLIDFGLAKARVRLSKSADGIVKGKIPYLAPEQAHGKPIDRRIDVYALGTTLWETVTMKRLFKRDTDVDTLRAIRDAVVPDVREMIPGFPDPLWAIIQRALRHDRDERFATTEDMGKELDAFVGDSAPMKRDLAELLNHLFPGQEARQARWERAATSTRVAAHTMPPPAPVPIASSTILEDGDQPPASRSSTVSGPPPPSGRDEDDAAKSAPKTSKAKSRRSEPPPGQPERRKKKKNKSSHRRRAEDVAEPPTAAPRKLWVSVAVVIAIVVALWAIFGSAR